MAQKRYIKGTVLINLQTRQKIVFGAFDTAGEIATCLDKDKRFVQIPRATLDTDYLSNAELDKRAREKRKGQAW